MTGVETWRTRHGDTVEVYRATDGFRYRVQARNGEIVEQGSEPYTTTDAAVEAATRHHPVIDDLTEDEQAALEVAIVGVTGEMVEQAVAALGDTDGGQS